MPNWGNGAPVAGIPTPDLAQDSESLTLATLVAFEACMKARVKEDPTLGDEFDKMYTRYENLKGYALGGVDGEARNAMKLALIQIVKMLF